MKVFAPLIRQPSAICVAVVRIAMASEPASASVMARQPISEPSQSAGRNLRFCSSEAWRTNRPFTRSAWWSKVAAEDMQTAPSSSPARQSSTSPSPAPPYCSGTHNPRMPSLAPSCHVSRGKRHSRSRSRALGATLSWANVAQHVAEHLLFRCQVDNVCRTCKHACLPPVWPGPHAAMLPPAALYSAVLVYWLTARTVSESEGV